MLLGRALDLFKPLKIDQPTNFSLQLDILLTMNHSDQENKGNDHLKKKLLIV